MEDPLRQREPGPDDAPGQRAGDADLVSLVLGALEQHHLSMRRDLRAQCAALQGTIEARLARLHHELLTSVPASEGPDPVRQCASESSRPWLTGLEGKLPDKTQVRRLSVDLHAEANPGPRPPRSGGTSERPKDCGKRTSSETWDSVVTRGSVVSHAWGMRPWYQRLHHLVNSPAFDLFCSALVLINVIVMFAQLEMAGYKAAYALRLREDTGAWSGGELVFSSFEHIFAIWFAVEFSLRLSIYRCKMFHSVAHVFDALIVLVTLIDQYLLTLLVPEEAGTNVSFGRMVRLIKLVKFMRAFRAATVFSELRVLIQTIASSFWALLWSVLLLGIVLLACGLFVAQSVSTFVMDDNADYNKRLWAYTNFGSAGRSVYTMFEATLSGCWPRYARPMIEEITPWYAVFWVIYVVTVVFAVIRVMGALFLSATLRAADDNEDMMVMRRMRDKKKYSRRLHSFFLQADTSGDGKLDREELRKAVEDPRFLAWLHVLELEVYEANALFDLLDDAKGGIPFDEFLNAAIRVKGHARAIDSMRIINVQGRCMKELEYLRTVLERLTHARAGHPESEGLGRSLTVL